MKKGIILVMVSVMLLSSCHTPAAKPSPAPAAQQPAPRGGQPQPQPGAPGR